DLSMDRLENVATPLTAFTVLVPDSVPLPGLALMASTTWALEPVTVLPNWSCTVTRTAGVIDTPAVALVGCTVKASLLAAAGVMVSCCGAGLLRLLELARLTNGDPARVSL